MLSAVIPLCFISALTWPLLAAAAPAVKQSPSTAPGPLLELVRPELRRLDARILDVRAQIDKLPPLSSGHAGARRGFHGSYSPISGKPFWVALDLGKPQPIDAVVLIPAHSLDGETAIVGYGFPLRFRVETSNEPEFRTVKVIADETQHDFPNPGPYPYFAQSNGAAARYVRLFAAKRWPQTERLWTVALGEFVVLSKGENVAIGSKVFAMGNHSLERGPIWTSDNLIDGQSDLGLPVSHEPSPTHGYESAMTPSPKTTKWVQVDLGRAVKIDSVQLVPAHPMDYPTPGYAFPLRFKVQVAQDPQFHDAVEIADYTQEDFLNPGDNMVTIPAHGRHGRYVRVTAVRLYDSGKSGHYSFALAELQVSSEGRNVALGKTVTSLDINNAPRAKWQIGAFPGRMWGPQYLVDGYSSRRRLIAQDVWLRELATRGKLVRELETLEGREVTVRNEAATLIATLSIGTILALGGGLVAYVRWSQRRRKAQMRNLRQRIARDLHDDIGSSLGCIRLTSQIARTALGVPVFIQEDLEVIERVASDTADSMRDMVWLLDDRSVSSREMLDRMEILAKRMLGEREFSLAVGPESPHKLSLEFRRNMLLAFKEALYNAIRHSGAGPIEVTIDGRSGYFGFRIQDHGIGFDPQERSDGHGLENMRNRAADLRGRVSIESGKGRGTSVNFRAPVS